MLCERLTPGWVGQGGVSYGTKMGPTHYAFNNIANNVRNRTLVYQLTYYSFHPTVTITSRHSNYESQGL